MCSASLLFCIVVATLSIMFGNRYRVSVVSVSVKRPAPSDKAVSVKWPTPSDDDYRWMCVSHPAGAVVPSPEGWALVARGDRETCFERHGR